MTTQGPTYPLDEVLQCVARGHYRITGTAVREAGLLGLDETDVLACVGSLTPSHFYKTMPALSAPGLWQDVYRVPYCNMLMYCKVQLVSIDGSNVSVIVNFKEK